MKFKMTPHKLMITMFAVILAVVPTITAILPKQTRSENENRALQKMPTLVDQNKLKKAENIEDFFKAIKWKYLTNRDGRAFKDDFETYFADHLAGREMWVKAANGLSRLVGKQEINGVYTLKNQMVQSFRSYDRDKVSASVSAINVFAERFSDIPMYFMLAPTSQEIFASQIPSYAGLLSEKSFIEEVYKQVENIGTIDCLSRLSEHAGDYIYYRTDHHWTSLGAFYAYQSAAKSLGYGAYGLGAFNIETVTGGFRGTLYSKTLDNDITPDSMDYYILAGGDPKIKMTCRNDSESNVYDSLYVRDFLKVKDKYSSFTGSNVPIVTIETDIDNGKSLLIIKDSYAHSLVPFLSKHYSRITMVDMRYINTDLSRFINVGDYSQVLFMFNVITFAEDDNLPKLRLTR